MTFIYVNHNLPIYPIPTSLCLPVHCLYLHLYSCPANRFFCNILLNSTLIYLFFSFDLLHFAWKTRSIHIFTNDPTSFFLMAEYIPICVYVCVCVVVVVHCAYSSDERLYILVSSPSSPQLALPLPCASFGCWAIHLQTHSSVPHTHWLFILQWVLQTPGLVCSEDVLS